MKDLQQILKAVVNTQNGMKLLKYLKEDYLLRSSVRDTVEQTYYELGKKELIQDLIIMLEDKSVLED